MYGTSNIFAGRSQESISNSRISGLPANHLGGSMHTQGQRENLGTYRLARNNLDDQPTALMTSAVKEWQHFPPASITTKEKTVHLTITELRVEDYYLIRNRKLQSNHANQLQKMIREGCFNEQIIKSQCYSLMPFSKQPPIDITAAQNRSFDNNGSTSNGHFQSRNHFSSNNQGGNVFSNNNQSNNTFGSSNQSSNNIFSRNNQSSNSNNVFSNGNSNNQTNNNSAGSIFNSSPNSFNNNSNNSNNIFSSNNNSNPSTFNNVNSSSNNNSNNIFGRPVAFNSNNTNNVFNNSTQNNQNTSNRFNNLSNNVLANNNSTSNSNSNNIFSNSNAVSTNNNQGNNKNINSTGNIFKNTTNNQNSTASNSFRLFSNQSYNSNNQNNANLSTNQMFQQNSNNSQGLFSNVNQFNSNNNQSLNPAAIFGNSSLQLLTSQAMIFDGIIKEIEKRVIDRLSPFQAQRRQNCKYYNTNESSYSSMREESKEQPFFTMAFAKNRMEDQETNVAVVYKKNDTELNVSRQQPKMQQTEGNKRSRIQDTRLLPIQSRVKDQENHFKSIKLSRTFSSKRCESVLLHDFQTASKDSKFICTVKFEIKWIDKLKDIPTEKIIISRDDVCMPCIDFNHRQGLQLLVSTLKEYFPIVRNDAKALINFEASSLSNDNQIKLVGMIEQRLINLDSKEYEVFYSNIKKGLIYNFTIIKRKESRHSASISWEKPINYETLDFSMPGVFNLELSEVICTLPALNFKCRITFQELPPKIGMIFNSIGKNAATESLRKFIQTKNEDQEGKFELCSINQDGSWTLIVENFN